MLPTTPTLPALFERGAAQGAVVFEPQFAERSAAASRRSLLIVADATEPNTGSIVQAYATAVVQAYERDRRRARRAASGSSPTVRMRFNPTRQSSNLFVPGLMAFVLTIISSLMTAISLTREKETGTMEALLVSPLRPWQIIVGKVAPYLVVGFVAVIGVVVEARLVFKVPMRGSLLLLLVEGLLFILVSLSLGILISARTSSQRVAMMGALVGTMLPTMLLSGFIFPIESMPLALRALSGIVPARWFVLVARSIMLKGIGLAYLWPPTLVLLAMAGALLVAQHAGLPRAAGVAVRRIFFLARAEALHVVRDRATLAQVLVVPWCSCSCCRTPPRSSSGTRRPTSSISIGRPRRGRSSPGSRRPATSASTARRRRSTLRTTRCCAAT